MSTFPVPVLVLSILVGVFIAYMFSSKKSKPEEQKSSRSSTHHQTAASAPSANNVDPTSTAAPAAAAKKKKPKTNKPKKAKKPESIVSENKFESLGGMSSAAEGDDEPDDNDSVESDAIIPSKTAQALLKKSQTDAKAAAQKPTKKEAEKAEKEAAEKAKKAEENKKKKEAAAAAAAAAKKEVERQQQEKQQQEKKNKKKAAAADSAVETAPPVEAKAEDNNLDVTPVAIPHYDGWAVVEDRRKNKQQSKKDSEEEGEAAAGAQPEKVAEPVLEEDPDDATPAIETYSQEVEVDAKKLGLLIGPKGATKLAIQNATATSIQMPKTDKETTGNVTLKISGPKEGVQKAAQALNELVNRGFCTLLSGEDFQEGYVAVHYKFLPDIIGKGGSVIRALNAHTGVKITVPTTAKQPGPDGKIPKVKIGLAGPKDKVSLTRALIKDITKYYVTPVTHPDLTYAEMDLTKNYYNYIIGSKGSEIKHIQNSYKVSIHIPDEEYSVNPNVVIVGAPDDVEKAKTHIEKIIERVNTAAATAAANAGVSSAPRRERNNNNNTENGNGNHNAENVPPAGSNGEEQAQPQQQQNNHKSGHSSKKHDAPAKQLGGNPPGLTQLGTKSTWANPQQAEPAEEAWTRDFLPPSSTVDIHAMLPTGAKYAPSVPIGPPKAVADSNPTPSGMNIEPKAPPASSAWNSQWV